jgi:uncharacterized membrane protein (DUF373 family)
MASLTNINKLKMHYEFTEKDADNLRQMRSVMEPFANEMSDKFYSYILEIKETAQYLNTDEIVTRHRKMLSGWFLNLFSGEYDNRYLARLQRVGYAHVKIKLDGHYVRELSNYFLSYKLESRLIKLADRFGYGMNLVLVIALMGISLAIIGQLGMDIWSIIQGHIEQGVIHILGTLLMLWVMIELMYTEIHSLRFGRFSITVFIKVVMVAVIRDLLVGTLEHGDWQRQVVLVGSVLVLGLVYWIMTKAETKEAGKNIKQ